MNRLDRRRNRPRPERVTAALRCPQGVELVFLTGRKQVAR